MANHLHLVGSQRASAAIRPPLGPPSRPRQQEDSDDKCLANVSACRECRTSIQEGLWQWSEAPAGVAEVPCPACRRLLTPLPAGLVFVEGQYFDRHRVELIDLILTRAARASVESPRRRLLGAKDISEGVVFATTDTELAEEIGDALRNSFGGDVLFSYAEARDQLRVHWRR